MRALTVIQQGVSLPFDFDRGGNSLDGWTCEISVLQKAGTTPAFSRFIPEDNNSWPGYITQSESTALALGLWYLVAKLSNTSTDEEELVTVRFRVSKAWV